MEEEASRQETGPETARRRLKRGARHTHPQVGQLPGAVGRGVTEEAGCALDGHVTVRRSPSLWIHTAARRVHHGQGGAGDTEGQPLALTLSCVGNKPRSQAPSDAGVCGRPQLGISDKRPGVPMRTENPPSDTL